MEELDKTARPVGLGNLCWVNVIGDCFDFAIL